jgi:hypothetical protein
LPLLVTVSLPCLTPLEAISSSAIFLIVPALPRQAVMVVQVHVEGGDDDLVVVVLDVGEGSLDVLFVVVVNQRDGAGDFLVAEVLPVLDQPCADHVCNRQGAVVVPLLPAHLVQLFGEGARCGDGKADDAVSL